MNAKQALGVMKLAAKGWVDDRSPSQGAALSYYTVFSIAPLLLIVISVAGLVFGAEAARGAIVGQLQGLVGEDSAHAIEGLLESVSEPKEGVISTIVGILLLLLGATTVLAELQIALDRIWRAPERLKPSGLWGWLRSRVVSLGMILGISFLLLVSLVASAAIAAMGEWWGGFFGGWEALAQFVNLLISFVLVTALFALIYKFLPHLRIQWKDVILGAAVTALFFSIGKFVIGLYIGKSAVTSGFGAAGSLVVVLVWVYYSAQVFLFGAEFTAAYARTHGSLKGQQAALGQKEMEMKDVKQVAADVQPKPVREAEAPQAIAARAARKQPIVDAAARSMQADRPVTKSVGLAMAAGIACGALAKSVVAWRRRHALATQAPLVPASPDPDALSRG